MARIFKITQEQKEYALREDITLNANVAAAGGDIKKAVETTRQEAQRTGVDLKKAKIQVDAANESRVITKKQMVENRIKKLKNNSDFYTVNDFMKKVSGNSMNESAEETFETDEERVSAKVGQVLLPIGSIRKGFKACTVQQVIDVMEKGGWEYLNTEEDDHGDYELYFTDGEDKVVIYYSNFYFKIQNIHSA